MGMPLLTARELEQKRSRTSSGAQLKLIGKEIVVFGVYDVSLLIMVALESGVYYRQVMP